MKRIIALGVILCCTFSVVSAHDFAVANGAGKTIWYNDVSTAERNAVEVTYEGTWYNATVGEYSGTIDIPTSITLGGKTYAVIGIGEQAFSMCMKMTVVTIPESIEYIRDKAFEACCRLKTVNYNAIRCADFSLSDYAPFSFGAMGYGTMDDYDDPSDPDSWNIYWSAYDLRTINIGASVERVPDYMFYGMGGTLEQYDRNTRKDTYSKEGVTSINFLGVPKEIGNQTFRKCPLLRSITIPDGVKSLGQALFADCDTLATVVLPDDMTEIPSYFFMNCKELTGFVFPSQVKSINYEAFKNCAKLVDLTNLPAGLTLIGPSAFRACQNVTSVILPASLTTLGGYSFSDCTALPAIEIPAAVKEIGNYAFEDCTNLASVTLNEGTELIGNFVFAGCRKLSKGVVNAPARMPRIYPQTFQGVDNTMQVNVEGGDDSEYAADANWGRFFAPAGTQTITNDNLPSRKIIRDGMICIEKGNKIYTVLGNEIR